MREHAYKIVGLVGSSTHGTDQAISNAVARASKTIRCIDWFEFKEIRGHVADGKIAYRLGVMRVGFRLED